MNEVLKAIKSRRSVRAYTEQQISQEDLNAILEAATYAPSGMNYQTWHFTAIQNTTVLEELNEKIKGAFAKSEEPPFAGAWTQPDLLLLLSCAYACHRIQ